ncbi:MAG: extracellular solute-binding protein [Lachnospiraceae bacterium]|nr:extracellular solute-binding protein [Lachnospiraceae bacterium]
MKKKVLSVLLAVTLVASLLAGCGSSNEPAAPAPAPAEAPAGDTSTPSDPAPVDTAALEDVNLVVWASEIEEDQIMTRAMIDEFIAANADMVNLTVDLGGVSESLVKDQLLTDITAGADVFVFADDQVSDLVMAGALQEVLINTADIIANNAAGAVGAASVDGTLYAYPMTADNGYFMFYNSEYFTEDDVKSLDRMMDVAAEAGKQVTMEMHGAWYNFSFFKGAGFTAVMNEDGTNFCDWNAPGGTDVVQAMLDIAAHPGFISLGDAEFQTGIADGSLIAGVNGPWNAGAAATAWGDNYAAAKLPTFTVNGEQVQMGGFAGFKLVGVNAFSANTGWAMLLAEWLTNYDNQVRRFEVRRQGPSNIAAASSEAVMSDPALSALAAQMPYSVAQVIGGNYWSPAGTLGEIIVQGNPDNIDLQTLLDAAVEGITAPLQ